MRKSELQAGDWVHLRFDLWDDYRQISHISQGWLFKKYTSSVYWSDIGRTSKTFRAWRIKGWYR